MSTLISLGGFWCIVGEVERRGKERRSIRGDARSEVTGQRSAVCGCTCYGDVLMEPRASPQRPASQGQRQGHIQINIYADDKVIQDLCEIIRSGRRKIKPWRDELWAWRERRPYDATLLLLSHWAQIL